MDFTANGRYAIASCEFSGTMIEVDVARQRVLKTISLRRGAMPQDVKLSPDGRIFYVADMMGKLIKRIGVGAEPHGLLRYPQPGRYSLGHTGVFR
jgi:DNA-binding beta-propeller fold protein YncE